MKHTQQQNPTTELRRTQRCPRSSEWEPLLYDYAEGLADEQTRAAVEGHLASCAYCTAAMEDIRWMISALKSTAPEPREDLTKRVMARIRTEEEENGRVIAEALDARTGRILPDRTGTPLGRSVRRVSRMLGGIAAALVLVIGLVYLVPLLRSGSGAASSLSDILGEMQTDDGSFADGVFVGGRDETEAVTDAVGIGAVQGSKEPAVSDTVLIETPADGMPVILRITGLSAERLQTVLSGLLTADGAPLVVTQTDDGYLVSPLSAFESAHEALRAAYPELGIEIVRAQTRPASYTDDAFYIQISEP